MSKFSVHKLTHSPVLHAARWCAIVWLGMVSFKAGTTADYHLEISKSQRLLQLKQAERVIREYAIAHGKGGKGTKRRLGDNRTPQGTYQVVKFKADSKFHFFIMLNYPSLLDAWHGYQDHVIDAVDFKNIATAYKHGHLPPQSTALGGYIGIHGIGETTPEKLEIHRVHNWTEGCIALRNDEILELKELVTIGTRVIISE